MLFVQTASLVMVTTAQQHHILIVLPRKVFDTNIHSLTQIGPELLTASYFLDFSRHEAASMVII
jgi:hypothetical protein